MSTEPQPTEGESTPSPYIRTFAKDFAALAAQNPGIVAANKSKQKSTQPLRKASPIVQAPKPITSQLDQEAADIDARTREEVLSIPTIEKSDETETIELPEIDSNDIFTKSNSQIEESITPPQIPVIPEQNMPAAKPVFVTPPPTPMMASAATEPTDAQRAEILARLKEKALAHQEAPLKMAPILPTPEPIVRSTTPTETPVAVVPIQPKTSLPQPESSSPIHTYKSDFSDHIEKSNASAFSVIAAQKDAPQRAARSAPKNNKVLVVVMSSLLLLAGGSGVIAAYLFMNKNAPVLLTPTVSSLIASDSQVKLSGTGYTLMKALAVTAKSPTADGTVLMTYVDTSTTTAQGVTEAPASGGAFITALNLQAPDILIRNIDPSSMVGVVHANTQSAPFFILRVTSYERTFAGMLQWEGTMFNSLSTLYPQYANATPEIVSTATTTPSKIFIPPVDPTQPAAQFIDEIIANRSVRALKDNAGRTIVLYGYADKQTLIIARDESAFTLLIQKLTASGN
jgi:hypothetical protein